MGFCLLLVTNISSVLIKVLSVNYLVLMFFVLMIEATNANNNDGFAFNGNLNLGGLAEISSNGLFRLTNKSRFGMGHVFYTSPFSFKNSSSSNNNKSLSFSTTFVFAIVREGELPGHGMAFLLSPTKEMAGASSAQHLGLFNRTNNGDRSNHIVAIEFDTFRNQEFGDINDNHVGVDVNGLESVISAPAGYFSDDDQNEAIFRNLSLASGKRVHVWVDYNSTKEMLNVTLSPMGVIKPKTPLLSLHLDISSVILDQMYVGFASATGQLIQSAYVLGWSFKLNGQAPELDLSKLPDLPHQKSKQPKYKKIVLAVGLSVVSISSITIFIFFILTRRRAKFTEIVEDWELKYGPYRFQYKDLYLATKAFHEKKLLGKGGFGQVYEGELNSPNMKIAVKRVSHGSEQGMKQFIAEIATIGRLRHPNLMRLLGYCRLKDELLLVYDYMPNLSLDKFIFKTKLEESKTLTWEQRFKIIKQVASGIAYLHEEWVEVVIHRDIRASNVLLDNELNAKLGDFGLARCISRAVQDPCTTNLAGTLGYIAPELARNGKATTCTDVFAFGAFCLEVACGRRPVESRATPDQVIMVDWVLECWKREDILGTLDSRLAMNDENLVKEMELVLQIGLICSHPSAAMRPTISKVVSYLNGQALLPKNLEELLAKEQLTRDFDTSHVSELCHSRPTVSISLVNTGR